MVSADPWLPNVPVTVLPPPTANPSGDELDDLDDEEEEEDSDDLNQIPQPIVTQRTTRELHSMVHEAEIDVDPPYQRGVVWPDAKQRGLINSLLRNFYVPPLVFATKIDEEGNETKVCVDGKQRLTSISKFYHGQIPFDWAGKRYLYEKSATQKKKLELPEHLKLLFSKKTLTCVEYPVLGDETEREMFQRVQLGMSLTAAEKLQALSSDWAVFIHGLEGQFLTDPDRLASILTTFGSERGRNFQGIAYMVYCCDSFPSQDAPSADRVRKWLVQTERLPTDGFQSRMRQMLVTYENLALAPQYNWCFVSNGLKKNVAPVEFIYIGVLLFRMQTALPGFNDDLTTKARAISCLRRLVREQWVDIRTNDKVAKTFWEHITRIVKNPTKFLEAHFDFDNQITTPPPKQKAKKGQKRKADDADDEYRPSISRRNR